MKSNNNLIFQPQERKIRRVVAYLNNSFIIWLFDHIYIQQSKGLGLEDFYSVFLQVRNLSIYHMYIYLL